MYNEEESQIAFEDLGVVCQELSQCCRSDLGVVALERAFVALKDLDLVMAVDHHCFPPNDNMCKVLYSIGSPHMDVLDYMLVSIVHKSHMIASAFLLV